MKILNKKEAQEKYLSELNKNIKEAELVLSGLIHQINNKKDELENCSKEVDILYAEACESNIKSFSKQFKELQNNI